MKKWFGIMLLTGALLLSGCDRNELEQNAFLLAMGIESGEDGQFHMYTAYPNLQDKDARENALSKDIYWDAVMGDLLSGTALMSESSNQNVDLNHLKVLILDKSVLERQDNKEQLIAFFREKRNAAWNTYVLFTDGELDNIFSDKIQISSCLGIYLENLLEGWTNLKAGTLVTVGDLMSQYYNEDDILLVPVVTVEEDAPVVKEFQVLENLTCGSEMTMEEVFEFTSELKITQKEK